MLNTDEAFDETLVIEFFEAINILKKLSPAGQKAIINKCVTMGEEKVANVLRQIADEPMVDKAKSPADAPTSNRAATKPTTEIGLD